MNEQALKARLKAIAKENNLTSVGVFKKLLTERFLVRVSKSKYSDKFIFKGGLLLSKLLKTERETVDIDFY